VRYQRRLSGPLRDRFDLWLDLPALPWEDMQGATSAESSAVVRERVIAARSRQEARQGCTNARLDGTKLQRVCGLDGTETERLLGRGVKRFALSARAVTRVLRVARTLADLDREAIIRKGHIAEALQLRGPDRGG
jgi:magnesium chelatase family protein